MASGGASDEPDGFQVNLRVRVVQKLSAWARYPLGLSDMPLTKKPDQLVINLASIFRPDLEEKLGVSFPQYTVVSYMKHQEGEFMKQYCIKIEVDASGYKFIYIVIDISPHGEAELTSVKKSQN